MGDEPVVGLGPVREEESYRFFGRSPEIAGTRREIPPASIFAIVVPIISTLRADRGRIRHASSAAENNVSIRRSRHFGGRAYRDAVCKALKFAGEDDDKTN